VGIDFGTSNSAAAWVDEKGKVRVTAIREGVYLLPSVAWYGPQGHALVGQPARQQIVDDPENTVFGFKRFLGRRFSSPFVHEHKDAFAYRLVPDARGICAVELRGAVKPLEDVAVDVLKRLLELVAVSVGGPVEEVVLTVPAHAGFAQRAVLRSAARRAGVRVKGMVNEPTAASMFYAQRHKGHDRTILVFDLGGGTFDATLLALVSGTVKVLATGGDAFLGGADFDAAVVDWLVERFQARHSIPLRDDTVAMQRLLMAAEAAKIELSRVEEVRIRVPCVAVVDDRFLDLEDVLTRKELEWLTRKLVARTVQTCRDLLTQAQLEPMAIDEIVFVGGMTRMPVIRQQLGDIFTINPESKLHPDLAVVVGAALLGSGDQSLIDVHTMTVGVNIPGGAPLELVPANTPVPAVRRVSLPRPPSDRTFVMGLYEAVDTTSLERDVLGTVRVEPGWLTKNSGALTLEAFLGADSELTLFLDAEGGQKLPLELKPPAPTPATSTPEPKRPPLSGPGFRSLAADPDSSGADLLQKMQARAKAVEARPEAPEARVDDDAQAPKPGDTLGGYLLLDVLGQGGMGTVYLAEHIRLGRRVALKMLRQRGAGQSGAIERFLSEARAINKIRHEHIIEVTDLIETDDGRTCYIMELLEGGSVAELLRRSGPTTTERTLRIASQVAQAMVAVHDAHIIHRDLKPENIFLTKRAGRDDFVKLLDFGVAKLNDGSGSSLHDSQLGVAIGTLGYMSPEQLIGAVVDARADIWSLGVCLYEMLTGRLPWLAGSERELLYAQLKGPPPPPSQLVAGVPASLDALVMQCLQREPADRPQTMREVRGRLDAIAEDARAPRAPQVRPAGDLDLMSATGAILLPGLGDRRDDVAPVVASAVPEAPGPIRPPATPGARPPTPTTTPALLPDRPPPRPASGVEPLLVELPVAQETQTFRVPTAPPPPRPTGLYAAVVVLAVVALVLAGLLLKG
jgi:molecular chaperone DnaK